MSKFNCKICNYKTDRKNDMSRHIQSPRHIEKVLDEEKLRNLEIQHVPTNSPKYICTYCQNDYKTNSSLSKHLHKCPMKNAKLDKLEKEKDEMASKITSLENDKQQMARQIDILHNLFQANNNINKPSVNSITYVVNHHNDAPPLLALEDYSELNDSEEMELIDVIIHYHKKQKLDKFIGEFIVKMYKKSDPGKQSIWNSDTNRLTYIIKELIKNNKSNWTIDKKGIKTKEYIINPLLVYLKPLVTTYMLELPNQIKKANTNKILTLNKNAVSAAEVLNEINTGILADNIIKQIAPHFYLSKQMKNNLLVYEDA